MPLIWKRHAKFTAYHHDPLVRSIGFIGRKHIDIGTKRIHIRQTMRRIADAIDNHKGASVMCNLRDFGHGVDITDDI